ncbi:MAG: hypothetical protein ACR2F6_04825 [Mycobacteriales bacterium]
MTEELSVKDKASESMQAGKQATGEVAQTAAGKAQEVAVETKAQARNLVSEAGDQLRSHVGEQHGNAVTSLRSLADELHSMAGNGQSGGAATELVGQAADRTRGAADWLGAREPGELLEELRRFARRRPGAFLLGALGAGVVAGRLTRGAVGAHSDEGNDSVTPRPVAGSGDSSDLTADSARPDSGTDMPQGTDYTGGAGGVSGGWS